MYRLLCLCIHAAFNKSLGELDVYKISSGGLRSAYRILLEKALNFRVEELGMSCQERSENKFICIADNVVTIEPTLTVITSQELVPDRMLTVHSTEGKC